MPPITDRSLLFGMLDLCKLFIFPSTAEGMSIMVLEAATLGIPLICSDIPENKSVLGERARYFRSEDSMDLAEKIQSAFRNPEKMAELAFTSKKWIQENYGWDMIAAKYDLLYQNYEKK